MQELNKLKYAKIATGWMCYDEKGMSGQGRTKEIAKANYDLRKIDKPEVNILNFNPFTR